MSEGPFRWFFIFPFIFITCAEEEDLPAERVGRHQAPVPDGQRQDVPVPPAAVLWPAQVPPADEGAAEQPGAPGAGYDGGTGACVEMAGKTMGLAVTS